MWKNEELHNMPINVVITGGSVTESLNIPYFSKIWPGR